jgi:hypothetical protein
VQNAVLFWVYFVHTNLANEPCHRPRVYRLQGQTKTPPACRVRGRVGFCVKGFYASSMRVFPPYSYDRRCISGSVPLATNIQSS